MSGLAIWTSPGQSLGAARGIVLQESVPAYLPVGSRKGVMYLKGPQWVYGWV